MQLLLLLGICTCGLCTRMNVTLLGGAMLSLGDAADDRAKESKKEDEYFPAPVVNRGPTPIVIRGPPRPGPPRRAGTVAIQPIQNKSELQSIPSSDRGPPRRANTLPVLFCSPPGCTYQAVRGKKLGKGAFSDVMIVNNMTTGAEYVWKRFKAGTNFAKYVQMAATIKVWNCPNTMVAWDVDPIVHYVDKGLGILSPNTTIWKGNGFVSEKMDGTAEDYLEKYGSQMCGGEPCRCNCGRKFMAEVSAALTCLRYTHSVLHTDVKLDNILYKFYNPSDVCPTFKLGDFDLLTGVGTPPQILTPPLQALMQQGLYHGLPHPLSGYEDFAELAAIYMSQWDHSVTLPQWAAYLKFFKSWFKGRLLNAPQLGCFRDGRD